MANSSQNYVIAFLGVVVAPLAALAVFNAAVDPFGVYPGTALAAFQEYKHEMISRTGKGELLYHGQYNVLLLGSSRVQLCIDPLHPAWKGASAINLGLAATNMLETSAVFRCALESQPVEEVLLFIDLLMFSDHRGMEADFDSSRFNPEKSMIDYRLENLVGIRAFKKSRDVLKDYRSGNRSDHAGRGFRNKQDLGSGHRQMFKHIIVKFLTHPEAFPHFRYSRQRLGMFDKLVRTCHQRGINLTVVITPTHALQLEVIRRARLWNQNEAWKRDLVALLKCQDKPVRLWDFSGYSIYNTERVPLGSDEQASEMKWFWESSHCKKQLGDLVQHRIAGTEPADQTIPDDFGVLLSADNVEAHLARINVGAQQYVQSFPEQIAWFNQICGEAGVPERN